MSGPTRLSGGCYGSANPTIVAYRASYTVELEPRQPVDRAGAMENAQNAFPTAPWTAHRTRRPQRPTGILLSRFEDRRTRPTTMTLVTQGG
jgi:hypothetical protein